jgi:hypothetical protein
MIEDNYCGVLALPDRTVFAQSASKSADNLASPTGFEPKTVKSNGDDEDPEVFDIWKLKKSRD